MNTDNSEAMRLIEPPNIENLKKIAASDSTTAIRNGLLAAIKWIQNLDQSLKFEQAASFRNQVAELEAERDNLHTTMFAAAVEIQAHWEAHCDAEGYGPANLMHRLERGIASLYGYDAKTMQRVETERDQLRAEVIANRERDALKLAALHIHSEMRSIVQAGGSNEAIGREFRKRVILDVEDEVVKLRAEVERLMADGEHDGQYYVCGDDNKTGYGDSLRAAIDAARTTHKEPE